MEIIRDSYYAYRLPGNDRTIVCAKGRAVEGISPNSFLIAPFDDPAKDLVSIIDSSPADLSESNSFLKLIVDSDLKFSFPFSSTTPEEHRKEVIGIVEDINGASDRKTIAARAIIKNEKIDLERSFLRLCSAFPDAFVFIFITPASGCWLGASPELLLKADGETLYTYALAGTRSAGAQGEWDGKNIEEHLIVKDFIEDIFTKWGIQPDSSPMVTKRAGNVEHLFTSIRAENSTDKITTSFPAFLSALSPTPALCGMPRERSKELINRYETHSRAYYGGFCGPFSDYSDFSLYVNLRSVWILNSLWCMFVGGGITHDSDPETEWIETENKSSGIINNLEK